MRTGLAAGMAMAAGQLVTALTLAAEYTFLILDRKVTR